MGVPGGGNAQLRRVGELGFLIPVVILGAFLTDLALRTLPIDLFSFRAWEATRTPGGAGPFLPNHRYHNDRAYGDLAALGNLPALREYHSETFVTDALGYPNPPAFAKGERSAAILFGTSFSVGSEVREQESLSARLRTLTGRRVYNASGDDLSLAEMRALTRRLLVSGGLVIFEYPEMRDVPLIAPVVARRGTRRCREVLASMNLQETCSLISWLNRHARVSPLQILSQRALKAIQNDRWLPNPYAQRVLRARLRNGEEMLFLPDERLRFFQARSEDQAARYFSWLASKLGQEDLRLLVVLVPKKFTVYQPLLRQPEPGPEESVRYLDRLEQRLRGAGVPVVNLTATFRAAAAAALERGAYIYWRDDTHWNAQGIALAAAEIARVLPRLSSVNIRDPVAKCNAKPCVESALSHDVFQGPAITAVDGLCP